MEFIIMAIFGTIAGISSSLYGFGGGIIIVPLLYHLQQSDNPYSMHVAIATSTSIVIFNSLNSAFKQHKNIIWNMVFPMIIYIMLGSILGVYISNFMDKLVLRWLFIVYLLYVIINNLYQKSSNKTAQQIIPINRYIAVFIGAIIGATSVLIGVGGSVMTVPLMRKMGATMKNAAAIANPLSIPVGVVGALGYIISAYSKHINLGSQYFGYIYIPALIILTISGFIGVYIGAYISNKISDKLHDATYVVLLALVLLSMLIK